MHVLRTACAALILLLSGCQAIQEAQDARDDATCRSYGIAADDSRYAACRMSIN
jgi:hypothetical protein